MRNYSPTFLFLIALIGLAAWLWKPESAGEPDQLTRELVKKVEVELKMPQGAHTLKSYERFYAINDEIKPSEVVAIFVYDPTGGGVRLVRPDELPKISDGGCDVLELRFSLEHDSVISFFCHGEA